MIIPLVKSITKRYRKNKTIVKKHNPTKKKELNTLIKAVDIYKKDCALCKGQAYNDIKCQKAALDKLFRKLPFIHKSIYPWQNYGWDYVTILIITTQQWLQDQVKAEIYCI